MSEMTPEIHAKAIRLGLINDPAEHPSVREMRMQTSIQRFGKPKLKQRLEGHWECGTKGICGMGKSARDAFIAWIALSDAKAKADFERRHLKSAGPNFRESEAFSLAMRFTDRENGIVKWPEQAPGGLRIYA